MKPLLLSIHDNGQAGRKALEKDFELVYPDSNYNKDKVVAINCCNENPINADLIKSLPNLEIIATFSVGYDHIDLKTAKEQGVKVTNTPDVLSQETADTVMSLLLATARRIVENDKYVRAGRWVVEGDLPLAVSIADKKIGIVGLGGIGKKVAKRCEAFEMTVVYHGRNKQDVAYEYFDDLLNMATEVDFLMLTCPGGEATKHLINAEVLMALGQRGMLINIARGSVVDERALVRALRDGIIAGAGLDVFADEPNVPEELIPMDNVVLLPHIGSATVETRTKMGQLVIDNILAHFAGEPLLTEVSI